MSTFRIVRWLSFLAVVAVALFYPVNKALTALLIGIVLYVLRGVLLSLFFEKKEKEAKDKGKNVFREMFELVAETAVFVFFVMTFIVQAFQIPTGSMEPTLLVGDFLLVNKFIHAHTALPLENVILPRRDVRRGDIVVFKSPPDLSKDFVKRVIGLPGETLRIKDRQVTIDDRPLEEKYKVHIYPNYVLDGDNYGPVTVPPGHLFVMGDNRDNSADSRVWRFLPLSYIKGRPWIIYFSYKAVSASTPALSSTLKTTLFKEIAILVKEGRARRLFRTVH
ncbi:MAG: signal peptidase I [Candidatus Aminicenantales bacterium]